MKQSLRNKIVRLSKELADCEDESLRKKLRSEIDRLKGYYKSSDPKSLGELMGGK